MRLILICFVFSILCIESAAQSLQEVYAEGTKAYENKDYGLFLQKMQEADSLRPNHPTILYNMSAGLALNDQKDEAVATLRRVLWMNAEMPFLTDEDFSSLKEFPPFDEMNQEIAALKQEVSIGSKAFELEDKLLHPEGIAYHKKTGQFFIGSVHQNKIVSINKKGEVSDFLATDDLMAIMGLQVDKKRGLLWACSTPAPEMKDFKEGLLAEVLCIDIKKKKIVNRYKAPMEGDWLGDLIVSKSGTVYVSNSSADNPTIYKVAEGKEELELVLDATELISLQGLALNANETDLFFSDYRYGLFKYDLITKELLKLETNIQHPLKGIDGLYYYDGELIAIHNGLKPFRIVRYDLDETETIIVGYDFLEKALPEMNEPTLGFIKNNEFHYISNSPWWAYDREKNFNEDRVGKPLVRKIILRN